jgi:diguanylate cyclase (GGDEF)-like protein
MAGTVHCLDAAGLERFLERRRANPELVLEISLVEHLAEVLRKANEFVPSSAGSILLDNPTEKTTERQRNQLTFIAAFGEKSEGLLGQRISADRGIAGHVYMSGQAYFAPDVQKDRFFWAGVDEKTEYTTQSIVAVPIRIGNDVCGVLELINRHGASGYSDLDRDLLAIFAGYLSISIENVLDGRQAQEIARRDNLTALYNDRYLHIALEQSIRTTRQAGQDLTVLFLDLDFFKRVNDSHGHLAGSQVLREVGQLLRVMSRGHEPEWLAARYGGDEFVLALPDVGLAPAVTFAESVRGAILAQTFCSAPGEILPEILNLKGLTCSIGVASLRRHTQASLSVDQAKSTLLRLADAAMYVAKETGRNQTAVAGKPIRRSTPTSVPLGR